MVFVYITSYISSFVNLMSSSPILQTAQLKLEQLESGVGVGDELLLTEGDQGSIISVCLPQRDLK
jgi:hypothetical protein